VPTADEIWLPLTRSSMRLLSVPAAPATTCWTEVGPVGGAVPVLVGFADPELAGLVALDEGGTEVPLPVGELASEVALDDGGTEDPLPDGALADEVGMLPVLMPPAGVEAPDAGKLTVVVDEPSGEPVLCSVTVVDDAGAGAATTAMADMTREVKAMEAFIMMMFVGVGLRGSCKV